MKRIIVNLTIFIIVLIISLLIVEVYTDYQKALFNENTQKSLYHFLDMHEFVFLQMISDAPSREQYSQFMKEKEGTVYDLIVFGPNKVPMTMTRSMGYSLSAFDIHEYITSNLDFPMRAYSYDFIVNNRMYITHIRKLFFGEHIHYICIVSDNTDFYQNWKKWRAIWLLINTGFWILTFTITMTYFLRSKKATTKIKATNLNDYYDVLASNHNALVCILNNAYEIEKFSPKLLHILQYEENSVIGKSIASLMKNTDLSEFTFLSVTEAKNQAIEIYLIDATGKPRAFLMSIFYNFDDNQNTILKIMLILQQIDSIKEIETQFKYTNLKNDFYNNVVQMLAQYNDLRSIIEFILTETKKIIVYDYVDLFMREEDNLICHFTTDPDMKGREKELVLKIGQGLTGLVAKIKKGMIVNDASRSHLTYKLQDSPDIDECLLACPLIVKSSVIGVVLVKRESLDYFKEEDQQNLETITQLTSTIFEKTRLESQLLETEKQVHTILNDSVLGVIILKDQKIIFANKTISNLLSYDADYLINKNILDFLDEKNKSVLISNLTSYIIEERTSVLQQLPQESPPTERNKDISSSKIELQMTNAKNTTVSLEIVLSNIDWHLEKCVLITAKDISEMIEVNEHLIRSQKLESIGALASGIAHDFKNILAGIMGAADLIMIKTDESTQAYNYAKVIKSSASRGAGLSQQLLNFSSKQKEETVMIDLNEVLQETIQIVTYTFNRNINIVFDLTHDPLYFEGDVVKIQQCILNLCVNARDAMPLGGNLTIKTKLIHDSAETKELWADAEERAYSCIEISDTGHGIPKQYLEKIFDSFFTTKEKNEGTGLGLATTKQIITTYKGNILVQSTIDVGSTFYVFLPWTKFEKKREDDLSVQMNLKKHIILLCDDEEIVLDVAKELFEELGCEVYAADNGFDALKLLEAHPEINVAVIDRIMPKMDGFTLLKEIKKVRSDLKVIFASGFIREADQVEFTKHGAFDFIIKPFRLEELIKLLGKL